MTIYHPIQLYEFPSQRRWLQSTYPDLAEQYEAGQLAPVQLEDIINARQGHPTYRSLMKQYTTSVLAAPPLGMNKQGSISGLYRTGYLKSFVPSYLHNLTGGKVHMPLARIQAHIAGLTNVIHGLADDPVYHLKSSMGVRGPSLSHTLMLPIGIGLGMTGMAAVKALNPRKFVKGVTTDMIDEYIQAENDPNNYPAAYVPPVTYPLVPDNPYPPPNIY